jgi:phosphotransferase system enzyme I (PtsI)
MLGADSDLTQTFLDMGVDELSVEPSYILKLRSNISTF